MRGLPGLPPCPPAQVRPCKVTVSSTQLRDPARSNRCSAWQITLPRPANPLTPPIPAACRPLRPHIATEPCPSPTLGQSARRTAGTADWWIAGRPTRPVRAERVSEVKGQSSGGINASCLCPGAVSGLGLDYLPAATSAAPETSWHQTAPPGSSWTNQECPMEESSTVLLDSLKVGVSSVVPLRLWHRWESNCALPPCSLSGPAP